MDYLTADEEENYTIAQANDLFDPETRKFGTFDDQGVFHRPSACSAVRRTPPACSASPTRWRPSW
ncbi:MAG: hypothetical protein ACLTMP_01240 [Eggerthella lenta]